MTNQKAAAKNHLHALTAPRETPKAVLRDAKLAITHTAMLEKRIDRLTAQALVLIGKHPGLQRILALLVSDKGIGETSAIALMGELLLLPPDLSHREWVTMQALTPKPSTPARVSTRKPAFPRQVTIISVPPSCPGLKRQTARQACQGLQQHLIDNGKTPLQGVCAVMRKLLHAIHGMLKHNMPFDNTRFYAIPASVS